MGMRIGALGLALVVGCGGAKSEAPGAPGAEVGAELPPPPPGASSSVRMPPGATAPTPVSGVGTMEGVKDQWTLRSAEGLPICPPPGLFQRDGYAVRYAGTQRPVRPNVRMRCAPVDFTEHLPVEPPPEGAFADVAATVGDNRILLQLAPDAPPVEACMPAGIDWPKGTALKAAGHPMGPIAKSCELMVFTVLARVD